MKYWLDTEFIEDGHTIELISIGMVSEDGRELYLVSNEFNYWKANTWVRENVLAPMGIYGTIELAFAKLSAWIKKNILTLVGIYVPFNTSERACSRKEIAEVVLDFCNPETYGTPEFWAYYADYDWVVFCQLFGTMMDLPSGFPMYCRDLKQELDRLGAVSLPEQTQEHNALADAQWNRALWDILQENNR